jgi:hypothetical protein
MPIIQSIGYNQQEIIKNILHLHSITNSIDCDPTYSKGNFYKKDIVAPPLKYDKFPCVDGVEQAESHKLPLSDNSISTIMFDPPFVMGGQNYKTNKEGSSIIAKRFTSFKDFAELKNMYSSSLKEFYRILKPDGIVIFKCQDCVSGGKQYFSHVWVMNEALKIGFYPKDLFILLAKNRLTDKRIQQHARKYHSYFWVFKKEICKVNYGGHCEKEKS